jgi:hypothetical protein
MTHSNKADQVSQTLKQSESKSVIDFAIEKPNETPDYFRAWHSPQVTGPAFMLS